MNCRAGRGKKIHRYMGPGTLRTACGLYFGGHLTYQVLDATTEFDCENCIKWLLNHPEYITYDDRVTERKFMKALKSV